MAEAVPGCPCRCCNFRCAWVIPVCAALPVLPSPPPHTPHTPAPGLALQVHLEQLPAICAGLPGNPGAAQGGCAGRGARHRALPASHPAGPGPAGKRCLWHCHGLAACPNTPHSRIGGRAVTALQDDPLQACNRGCCKLPRSGQSTDVCAAGWVAFGRGAKAQGWCGSLVKRLLPCLLLTLSHQSGASSRGVSHGRQPPASIIYIEAAFEKQASRQVRVD